MGSGGDGGGWGVDGEDQRKGISEYIWLIYVVHQKLTQHGKAIITQYKMQNKCATLKKCIWCIYHSARAILRKSVNLVLFLIN